MTKMRNLTVILKLFKKTEILELKNTMNEMKMQQVVSKAIFIKQLKESVNWKTGYLKTYSQRRKKNDKKEFLKSFQVLWDNLKSANFES